MDTATTVICHHPAWPSLDHARILAFRLANYHVTERLGPRSLVKAAAACGVQETPVGSAAVALAARVEELTRAAPERGRS